ncbi:MAG: GTP pyrophosphokinase [Coriobacteriales bacterium]|jgi:putative GTP pyrophosphokinase
MPEQNELLDETLVQRLYNAFQTFDPNSVKQAVNFANEFTQLMSNYKCAILQTETKLNILNEGFSLKQERTPIESIHSRVKSPESIAEKLRRRNYPLTLDSMQYNLDDIAGVRVVCSFIDDIYMVEKYLTDQDDIRVIARKDYIEKPKENGYRSLHLIIETPIYLPTEKKYVKVEIQLRTIAMEFWGNLEHQLRYKKDLDENKLQQISSDLKECAEISNMLDIKMQRIRYLIEKEEVPGEGAPEQNNEEDPEQ